MKASRAFRALLLAWGVASGAGLEGGTVAVTLMKAEVAGEAVHPAPPVPTAMAWDLAGARPAWTPGAGVRSASTGDAFRLVVGDAGGDLVSPELAVSAARFGRLVVEFGEPPALADAETVVTWSRGDGPLESWSGRIPVEVPADGRSRAVADLESSLRWYGLVKSLAVRLPRTTDGSPIAVRAIRLEPRRTAYTWRPRVEIKEVELAREVSPFQARAGLFLPPGSRYELETPAPVSDVRFGLGIVGPAGALAVGGHDGDFTTVLDVSVLDRVSGRALASLRLPIVVQDSRWLDYTLPVPGGRNGVRLVFEYRDAAASTVVVVGRPRATTRAPARTTVLATVDALQRKNLSIYGYPRSTPAIDAVGREGYVFARAYSQANNTPTAVIALLNSRYPENAPWDGPRPDRPSLARFLSDRSVYTVLVTANAFLQEDHIAAGFDEVVYVSNRGRHTSEEVEAAMARVLRAHQGEDLFLYAHFLDPHAPYVPPLHTAGRYRRPSDALAEQITANLDPWVYRPQHLEPGLNTNPVLPRAALSAAAVQRVRDLYDEEVLDVDIHLGRVWELMKQLRVYDDATVVVSADHGEEFYEHGGVQHGGLGLYDEVVGVPLVVKLPRRHSVVVPRPGSRLRHIVQLVDLYPTIVEAMGFAPPPGLVGENLFRVERGYAISVWMLVPGWRRRSIVDGEYRLITGEERTEQAVRTDPPLLFHLPSDPGERVNLAEREPARVRALEARMRAAIQADASSAPAPAATSGTERVAP